MSHASSRWFAVSNLYRPGQAFLPLFCSMPCGLTKNPAAGCCVSFSPYGLAGRARSIPSRSKRLNAFCVSRSEEHTSELQSHSDLVCRLLLEKKNKHDASVIIVWSVVRRQD